MHRFLLQLFALFAIFFAESASASSRDLGARQSSDAELALKTSRFLLCDERGAPVRLVKPSGEILWSASYDAFGQANTSGDTTFNLRLPGQYYDAETGLHYNMARYYDPITGRYTQPDPIFADTNPYAYANANPYAYIDPMGTSAIQNAGDLGSGIGIGLYNLSGVDDGVTNPAVLLSNMIFGVGGAIIDSIEDDWNDGNHINAILDAVTAVIGAKSVASAGMNLAEEALEAGTKALPKGETLAANAANAGDEIPTQKCPDAGCFSAGHLVFTQERGIVAIETLRKGEHVLSRDEQGHVFYAEIEVAFNREVSRLMEVSYQTPSGEQMHSVTPEHPYSRDGKEWIAAKDLNIGDRIALKEGFATITKLKIFDSKDHLFRVFNMTVKDAHSYFVLPTKGGDVNEAVWVHNNDPGCPPVVTPHTQVTGGRNVEAPEKGLPNSIYERSIPGGGKSVTYYDEFGNAFSMEHYGQTRSHGVLGFGPDGKSVPHEHRIDFNDRNQPLINSKRYRELDSDGNPIGDWHYEGRPNLGFPSIKKTR